MLDNLIIIISEFIKDFILSPIRFLLSLIVLISLIAFIIGLTLIVMQITTAEIITGFFSVP